MVSRPCYLFGPFRLSADGTMLSRDEVPIPLAPKALRTLLTLVEHAGEVVTKTQLVDAVWPDSFVEDTGLTRNISVVRQALGEDGEHLIATVARLGYRFTAPVGRADGAMASRLSHASVVDSRKPHVYMVGRASELNELQRAFESVAAGPGRIIAVTGEPGIGKTTIVDSFLGAIEGTGRVCRGRCSQRLAGAEPHLPILEALHELTTEDPRMMQILRSTAPTWLRHIAPRSLSRSSSPDGDDQGTANNSERLMRELTAFLEEASIENRLVLVIEDLHWTDVSTVDVLAHLAARLSRLRILVIITYRHHELALRDHPFMDVRAELIARGQLLELAVSPLTRAEVREYVRSTFHGEDIPAVLPALVFEKTEGNPLFMVDLVRYLRESRNMMTAQPGAVFDVPDSLRALIDRTLRALQPAARELVSIAAVQGREFDSATLAKVSGIPAADVEETLQRVAAAHPLVTRDREITMPDGTISVAYRFVHILYQDALNETMSPSRRVEWARRIAEVLMVTHAGRVDHIAGQLAALFETGRDFWQASQHFLAASRTATQRFAFREAVELATRGLTCVSAASEVEQCDVSRRELDLAFARLVPLASLEGYASAEVERLSERLVSLAQSLNDAPAIAAALSASWLVRIVRGQCLAAKDAGMRLVELGRSSNDAVLLMNAHMYAQIACHHLGEFADAERHSAAAVSLIPRTSPAERRMVMFDPIVASLAESSRNHWITGRLARSQVDAAAAVNLGREVRHPDSLAFALAFDGWLHGYRRNWAACTASTESGIAIASESGSVQTLAWNQCVHGWSVAHAGDIDKGRSELSSGIDASTAIMGQIALPQFYAMMAEVLLLDGDVSAARTWVQRAIDLMDTNGDRYVSAEVYRLAARCCAAKCERKPALAHLHTAIGVARSQHAKLFELRAAVDLAALDPQHGQSAVAAALIDFPEPEPWPDILDARRVTSTAFRAYKKRAMADSSTIAH